MSHPNAIQKATDPTQRQVIDVLFRDRAVRAYTFTTLGALAMIFVVMFMSGSDLGGALVVIFGCAALVLRWTAAPPFLLLIIAYFLLFPFGIPDPGTESPFEIRGGHFRVTDAVLVMAVLVYLRSQYRIFGFVHQIVPFENVLRRKGDVPTRRPPSHIRSNEIAWLIGIAAGIVIVGQMVWWLVNSLEFASMDDVPLRWADKTSVTAYRRVLPPGEFRPGQNRFFMLIGVLFFGALFLRLVFGYWRLRVMNPAEGAMVLTDTSWAESHRERVRVERWRIWGRQRAEEEAKRAETEAKRAERAKAPKGKKRRN